MRVGAALVDVALVNGIFNLNPARHPIYRELARVVRRGVQGLPDVGPLEWHVGRLQVATVLMV